MWHFSSKAAAYRFGENPDIPKTAALEVCFGYLWLIREAELWWPLYHVGCLCRLIGPSVNALVFKQNAVHFIWKPQPICFQTHVSAWPVFSDVFLLDREPEIHILVAVLIHNLISVCCSISRLLRSSVVECAGIRLYWLKFYSHQIRLTTESPDQAGFAVMWPRALLSSCWELKQGSLLLRCS